MNNELVVENMPAVEEAKTRKGLDPFSLMVIASFPAAMVLVLSWFGIYTFVNGYIVQDLGCSNQTWTAVTLWFSGGMIFWSIFCPEISSVLGRRRTVIISQILAAGFYFGIAVTRNLVVIQILLFLMSFVAAAYTVAWLPIVAHVGRKNPGRALAISQFTNILIGVFALISGGYILSHINYQWGFVIFGSVCVVCAIFYSVTSRALEEGMRSEVVTFRKFSKSDFLSLLTGPFAVVVLAGTCMEPFNYHTMNQLFPNLARDLYHLSDKGIGAIVALVRIPALVVLIILTYVVDKKNMFWLYGLSLALSGLMLSTLSIPRELGLTVVCSGVFYVFWGGVWGTEIVTVHASVEPHLCDAAFGVMSVLGTVSVFMVGMAHNRMLAAGFSIPNVFLVCGIMTVIGGSTLILYSRKRRIRNVSN
ncbi:MAG: MFS transporter [Phycisphaerae bacterium]